MADAITAAPTPNQMTPQDKALFNFRKYFEQRKGSLSQVVTKTLTPDRVIRIALSALARTPKLLSCSAESVFLAVHSAAQLGFEAGSPLGHAYLVPYGSQCQLIVGYRGMIDLARRSGQILSIEAHVIHDGDEYEVEYGLEPKLRHKPNLSANVGKPIMVYAVAKLKGGGTQCDVMTVADVEKIRKRSRASENGPWVTDYEEMMRKTVVRRLWKYLPVSIEMATAMEVEDAQDNGESLAQITVIASEVADTRADALADSLPDTPALTNAEPAPAIPTPTPAPKEKAKAKKAAEAPAVAPAAQSGEPTIESLLSVAWLPVEKQGELARMARAFGMTAASVADTVQAAQEHDGDRAEWITKQIQTGPKK